MAKTRTFLLLAAAATALPAIAAAQEKTIFVTSGAMQDREQRVTVFGAMQDREQRVTVIGATRDADARPAAANPAGRNLRTLPVVYEDAPATASARTAVPAKTPAASPSH